jgi:hypothetical protein
VTPPAGRRDRNGSTVAIVTLRGLVVAGLVVDAVIHLRLAAGYQLAAPGGIGEGTLFRAQAGLALLVALAVLVRSSRILAALALLIAAAALGAVLLYRYVDVPSFGPVPSMYEPVWFPEKTLSAVAEAVALLAAVALLFVTPRRRGAAAGPPPRRWGRTLTATGTSAGGER